MLKRPMKKNGLGRNTDYYEPEIVRNVNIDWSPAIHMYIDMKIGNQNNTFRVVALGWPT